MKKRCEIEIDGDWKNEKNFFRACQRKFQKIGNDIENWICFEEFISPSFPRNSEFYKNDISGKNEIVKCLPFDIQYYEQDSYNFIIEFSDGHGYLYLVEFE